MVLSFVSAGLLFSVQLIYPKQIAANHSEVEMALAPATSSPADRVVESEPDEPVPPSVKKVHPFLTGFSAIQFFVARGPVPGESEVGEQDPKRGAAQLAPPSSPVNLDNSLDSNRYIDQQTQRQSPPNRAKPLLATFFSQFFRSQPDAQSPGPQAHDQQSGTSLMQPDEPQTAAITQTPAQPQRTAPEPIRLHLVVDLSDRQLTLYEQDPLDGQDTVINTYPIAVGKAGWETPVGEFVITDKDPSPTWRHPLTGELVSAGDSSPLGTRWIGFWTDGVYQIGFHGTNQAQSIGQAISHGCIRLQNAHIETLYTKVDIGTPVLVQP
ncbi:MAG: L,D-transpeptidase [Leptolyngbyaceae bacterium]|nr:L,D-transpeptidase [Leptolyngbyaceae bacterium]